MEGGVCARERNMTSGSVFRGILSFSLPYLFSYFLQTLYGLADLFIIGVFNGVASTTAVSIGSQIMHMVTVMLVGLAMGSTVMIARAVGASRREDASRVIGNSAVLFLAIALALSVILLLFIQPIIAVMQTPQEAIAGLTDYLTICIIGIPFITAYNIISAIFRGMGDTTTPMFFVMIACAANIGLDFLLIGYFQMGAAGAALGTTLAQTISVIISLVAIAKKRMLRISVRDFMPRLNTMKELLSIGIPVSLQDGFIQISFLIITMIANTRGLTDAAAVGVVEKIIGILFLIPSSMLSTVSALCAQNIGAKQYARARKTLFYGIGLTSGLGLLSAIAMMFLAHQVVWLFVKDAAVIHSGALYLYGYVWDCVFAGVHFCFSGYFCANGKSFLSFLHNSLAIVFFRIPLAYLASAGFPNTLTPMGIATAIGSAFSVAVCLIAYRWLERRNRALGYY